jgi:hypothetical protein
MALIIALILSANVWGFTGTLGKKMTYWALVIILVISFGKLIPDDVYKKVIGFAPYQVFTRSETEKTLRRAEKLIAANADSKQATELKELLSKIEKGESLDEEEQAKFDKIQEKVDEKSLPAQTKKIGGAVKESADKLKEWWREGKKNNPPSQKITLLQPTVRVKGSRETYFTKVLLWPGKWRVTPGSSCLVTDPNFPEKLGRKFISDKEGFYIENIPMEVRILSRKANVVISPA